jgi:tetratricopeptide (TPR) repeat protein
MKSGPLLALALLGALGCANLTGLFRRPDVEVAEALGKGDLPGAAEIAERAFAERPDDPRSRLALVRARVAQGRAEEALPHLAFLQAAPIGDEERSAIVAVSADVWAGVGQAQLSRGEYDRAIRSFESSLLVTERAPLRASLGEARRRAGTTTSAPGPRRMKRRARVSRCGPTCSIPSSPRASRRTR